MLACEMPSGKRAAASCKYFKWHYQPAPGLLGTSSTNIAYPQGGACDRHQARQGAILQPRRPPKRQLLKRRKCGCGASDRAASTHPILHRAQSELASAPTCCTLLRAPLLFQGQFRTGPQDCALTASAFRDYARLYVRRRSADLLTPGEVQRGDVGA